MLYNRSALSRITKVTVDIVTDPETNEQTPNVKFSSCLDENMTLYFSVNDDEFSKKGFFTGDIFFYEEIIETENIIDPYIILEDGEQGDDLYSIWYEQDPRY